ncbi:MAG: secreted hydrolase-like protein [Ramlibacter sp.]|nr:secreted hydrolase-like protein [Ramlibacter sp.]
MRRRSLMLAAPGLVLGDAAWALPAMKLEFPRDHGAHPGLRTEWWYVTGDARSGEREFGFQVTFFRSRVDGTQGMTSRFAAKQLIFAHAALTDVQGRKLWHDQRIAREGFEVAAAAPGDTRVRLRDWTLERQADTYRARVAAADFSLDLQCTPTQPVLLQGKAGLSRKGPEPAQASYYYSAPQLAVRGAIALQGQRFDITGKAWLDHEWSEEVLHPDAVGWDWIGMNLDDGSALTAFRLRKQDGTALWDGGSFRSPQGGLYTFSQGEAVFSPQRRWTSPLSQASYPVEWIVRTPADFYTVKAVIDNQELDSRASTGAIYWEGLSELFDSNGKRVGRGYLEMTGYAGRLRV